MQIDNHNIKKVFWQKKWKIPGTPWTICGFSKSAYRTGFRIKDLDLMLDAGPQNFVKPAFILLTHTHVDHIACLPFTLIGAGREDIVVQIYGPESAEPYVRNYINTLFSTNSMIPQLDGDSTDAFYMYNGAKLGSTFKMNCKNANLCVEVFECDHSVPTVSYGISEYKTKLKPEFSHMSGKEIGALRKAGECVTNDILVPRFTYVCDTSIEVFDINPNILKYPVVFIECTFIYLGEEDMAIDKKHIHWLQLKPIVDAHPEITFMLFHFSQRYTDREITLWFKDIPNVHTWCDYSDEKSEL